MEREKSGSGIFTEQGDARSVGVTGGGFPLIKIIGGGFSGLMVLTHLVRESASPLHIDWYEPSGDWGRGTAYGKSENIHLLNVRANRMGAFAGEPEGFWQWLQAQPENRYAATDFVPRPVYGDYLQHILRETLALAQQKNIAVTQHVQAVVSYDQIASQSGSLTEQGDARSVGSGAVAPAIIILACGTPPPREFTLKGDATRYLADPWRKDWPEVRGMQRIGIIGTGLTAVDMVLSLQARSFAGEITAVSRHGWWPEQHQRLGTLPQIDWLKTTPNTALGLLVAIRREVKIHGRWQEVIDSLRPVTQPLWQRLPLAEKRKLLRRLFTLWNIHRHRMAPEIGAQLQALLASGRLHTLAASAQELNLDNFDLVINCTGPDFRLVQTRHPLLRDLLDRGLITPDEVGLGMLPDPAKRIHPTGALTIGTYFESFAIPELREQAKQVAMAVLQS